MRKPFVSVSVFFTTKCPTHFDYVLYSIIYNKYVIAVLVCLWGQKIELLLAFNLET
jgi:hypothetical protein